MPTLLVAHLLVAAVYAGFQWTTQVLVYRQFPAVPPEQFTAYERAHQRRASYLAVPLFAGLSITTILLVLERPSQVPSWAALASALLLVVLLGVTALTTLPIHARLGNGWSASAYRMLLRVDAVRVAAATLNVLLAGYVVSLATT